MPDKNVDVINIQKVLKAMTMDETTKGVSTDAAPTPTLRSWADEESARKNERKQQERQTKKSRQV